MREEFHRFVKETKSAEDRKFRKELIKKFSIIHNKVTCGHTPSQFVLMAEYILGLDVPMVSSARECIQVLWPLLKPGGLFFTHEAMYPSYIEGILDKDWWRETLNQCPPVIFGAGSGLSPMADTIAYMRK